MTTLNEYSTTKQQCRFVFSPALGPSPCSVHATSYRPSAIIALLNAVIYCSSDDPHGSNPGLPATAYLHTTPTRLTHFSHITCAWWVGWGGDGLADGFIARYKRGADWWRRVAWWHGFGGHYTGSLRAVAYSQRRVLTVTVTKVSSFLVRFLLKDRKCITESFTYIQRSPG